VVRYEKLALPTEHQEKKASKVPGQARKLQGIVRENCS
jgi:hypothetical protein